MSDSLLIGDFEAVLEGRSGFGAIVAGDVITFPGKSSLVFEEERKEEECVLTSELFFDRNCRRSGDLCHFLSTVSC